MTHWIEQTMAAHEIILILILGILTAMSAVKLTYTSLTLYSNYVTKGFMARKAFGVIMLNISLVIYIYLLIFDIIEHKSKIFAFSTLAFGMIIIAFLVYREILHGYMQGGLSLPPMKKRRRRKRKRRKMGT